MASPNGFRRRAAVNRMLVTAVVLLGATILALAPALARLLGQRSAAAAQVVSAPLAGNAPIQVVERPASPTAYPRTVTTIPAPFRGEWNAVLADCGTDLSDSALRISARDMAFYESVGQVSLVTETGPREIAVKARFTGEGETWTRDVRMQLSQDGQTLTDVSPDVSRFARRRCVRSR